MLNGFPPSSHRNQYFIYSLNGISTFGLFNGLEILLDLVYTELNKQQRWYAENSPQSHLSFLHMAYKLFWLLRSDFLEWLPAFSLLHRGFFSGETARKRGKERDKGKTKETSAEERGQLRYLYQICQRTFYVDFVKWLSKTKDLDWK